MPGKNNRLLFSVKENLFLLVFIIFLPLYFILDANNQFWGLIPFWGSLKIVFYLFLGSLLSLFLLFLLMGLERAAVLLSIYMSFYLFFKTIQTKLISFDSLTLFSSLGNFLAACSLGLLAITIIVLVQSIPNVKRLGQYMNLLFLVLFLVEVGKMSLNLIRIKPKQDANTVQLRPVVLQDKPDIYLIVLDEYGGIQSMQDKFGYNNIDFVKYLQTEGFFVASAPNSNYNSTLFSLSSMLNLNYSNSFIDKDLKDISAFGNAAKEIQYNCLTPFLVSNGYVIKNYSGFRIGDIPSGVFYFMAIENRLALQKTFGSVLKNEIFTRVSSNSLQKLLGTHIAEVDEYNHSVYTYFLNEASAKKNGKPKFVYAHFFMPHEPFLNKKDGTVRKYADAFFDKRKGTYGKSYIEYLEFVNKRMRGLVNELINEKGEKIILLVSDHGERFVKGSMKGSDYNNFFAIYNSQKNYTGFTDTFPLINTFRVVLNTYFNQRLPMLGNKKFNVYTGKMELF